MEQTCRLNSNYAGCRMNKIRKYSAIDKINKYCTYHAINKLSMNNFNRTYQITFLSPSFPDIYFALIDRKFLFCIE